MDPDNVYVLHYTPEGCDTNDAEILGVYGTEDLATMALAEYLEIDPDLLRDNGTFDDHNGEVWIETIEYNAAAKIRF